MVDCNSSFQLWTQEYTGRASPDNQEVLRQDRASHRRLDARCNDFKRLVKSSHYLMALQGRSKGVCGRLHSQINQFCDEYLKNIKSGCRDRRGILSSMGCRCLRSRVSPHCSARLPKMVETAKTFLISRARPQISLAVLRIAVCSEDHHCTTAREADRRDLNLPKLT